MLTTSFLVELLAEVSSSTKILSDSNTEEFKTALSRWTDLGLQVPGAVVLVASEEDLLRTVQTALKHNVPFVPKSGGHSAWSTIGLDGIIIDLTNFTKIKVNTTDKTVQVQGGVLNKDLVVAAYEAGLCVSLGGASTVGVIPQALGGGICSLSHLCGTTSDNIISATVITASGELITVDESTPDLLWALRGAGQYFGLVTSLTLQAYPLSILGTPDGTLWTGTFIFEISQFSAVAKATEALIEQEDNYAAVLCVVTTNPFSGTPCVLFKAQFFGPEKAANAYFAPIKDLNPTLAMGNMTPYSEINKGTEPFCVKGGFKRFNLVGIPKFTTKPWAQLADLFIDLGEKCVDAKTGGFGFELMSGRFKSEEVDSAWSHRDVKVWIECLSWYTNPESSAEVDRLEAKAIAIATEGFEESQLHTYQNFTRQSSLESRFGGKARVDKLRVLKQKWDPTGVFTKVFL